MVCAKCEKKLAKLATKDTYKDGTSKVVSAGSSLTKSGAGASGSSSSTSAGTSGGRKIGENKLLSKKRV
ncbi:hypothetical protein BGW41_008382 [Actinomortierella wolfii]|nr:hypothetical protein BGW41_008382 [Actinomortierella wolfii]